MIYTERQKQIIETSMKLIASGGIQSLTMKRIAEGIDITEAAIYRHFKSKLDILLGILEYSRKSYEASGEEFSCLDENSLIVLEKIFASRFENFTQKPELAIILFSEEIFREDTRLTEAVAEIMQTNCENIERIVERGAKAGEVREDISPEYLSLIVIGPLRLLVKRWVISGNSFNLIKEGENLWNSLEVLISK